MIDFLNSFKEALIQIRNTRPVVHHITNLVTINHCANATASLGASPVMASAKEEAADITALASSLVLNTGTPDTDRFMSILLSGKAANKNNIPVVLDPVGVGATDFRRNNLNSLLTQVHPTVIKGNLAEIKSLAGISLKTNKVIDSQEETDSSVVETAVKTAQKFDSVIIITGKEDIITDGKRICKIKRGTEMFTYMSGAGCITASIIGCFVAVEKDPFIACCHAVYAMDICGECSAKNSTGPGDFIQILFNSLYNLHEYNVREEGISFE